MSVTYPVRTLLQSKILPSVSRGQVTTSTKMIVFATDSVKIIIMT